MTTNGLPFVLLSALTVLTALGVAAAALWSSTSVGRRAIVLVCVATALLHGAYVMLALYPGLGLPLLPIVFVGAVGQTTAIYGFGSAVVVHLVSRGKRRLPIVNRAQLLAMNLASLLLFLPGALNQYDELAPENVSSLLLLQGSWEPSLVALHSAVALRGADGRGIGRDCGVDRPG